MEYYDDIPTDEEVLAILQSLLPNFTYGHNTSNGQAPPEDYILDRNKVLAFIHENGYDDLMGDELAPPKPINPFIQGIQLVGVPLILFPGIVGNALCLLVYLWTHLKLQSSSIYLAFLNIVDIAYLLTLLPHWTPWLGYGDWILKKSGLCQLNIFLNHCFALLSVWSVVSISAERYVVVFYPWLRHRLCSRRRTVYVVLVMLTTAAVFMSYTLWATNNVELGGVDNCFPNEKVHRAILQLFVSLDTLCRFVIPGVLIAFMNGRIGYHIATLRDRNSNMRGGSKSHSGDALVNEGASKSGTLDNLTIHEDKMSRGGGADFNCQSCNYVPSQTGEYSMEYVSMYSVRRNQRMAAIAQQCKRNRERRRRYQINATRSLLAITSMFFLFNVPMFTVRIQSDLTTIFDTEVRYSLTNEIWHEIALFLYYLNFSANFLMYVAVSRHFRQGLKRLFNRMRKKMHVINFIKSKH